MTSYLVITSITSELFKFCRSKQHSQNLSVQSSGLSTGDRHVFEGRINRVFDTNKEELGLDVSRSSGYRKDTQEAGQSSHAEATRRDPASSRVVGYADGPDPSRIM